MKNFKYFIPAFIWMIVIFIESSMTGDSSSNQSNIIVQFVYSILSIPLKYQNLISFIIRKCAHITEYTILTLLLFYGLYKNDYHYLFLSFVISFIYACGDEIHQLFVNGRAGQIQDIFIDSIGIIIAGLIIYFIKKYQLKS